MGLLQRVVGLLQQVVGLVQHVVGDPIENLCTLSQSSPITWDWQNGHLEKQFSAKLTFLKLPISTISCMLLLKA